MLPDNAEPCPDFDFVSDDGSDPDTPIGYVLGPRRESDDNDTIAIGYGIGRDSWRGDAP